MSAKKKAPAKKLKLSGAASMSGRAYAKHRGLSHTAVQKAIKEGRIKVGSDGRILVAQADKSWNANTDPGKQANGLKGSAKKAAPARREDDDEQEERAAPPQQQAADGISYQTQRAIREGYQARLAKLEYESKTGKLGDVDQMRVAQFTMARKARDALLAVPSRVAPLVIGLETVAEIEKILDDEIRVICSEIARAMQKSAQ